MSALLRFTMLVLATAILPTDVAGAEPGTSAGTGGASPSATLCAQSPDCVNLTATPEIASSMELAKAQFDQVFDVFKVDPAVIKKVLDHSQGFAVLPDLVKSGFNDAQIRGQGFLVYRLDNGHWGPPLFLKVHGTSVGPLGQRRSDVLVVFNTKKSVEQLLTGKPPHGLMSQGGFVLYGGSEPANQSSGIVTYIVNQGMVRLQTTDELHIHLLDQTNLKLYGKQLKAGEILKLNVEHLDPRVPAPVTMFVDHINKRIDALPSANEWKSGDPMPQPQH